MNPAALPGEAEKRIAAAMALHFPMQGAARDGGTRDYCAECGDPFEECRTRAALTAAPSLPGEQPGGQAR